MNHDPRLRLTDADGLADNPDPAFIVLDIRRRDIETGNIASALERLHVLTDSAENMRLYRESLIPDHRGDVLGLLENIDNVIDEAKKTLAQFAVERPEIPSDLAPDYLELARAGTQAAQHLVSAVRAFFRDLTVVPDHIHKVYFYEKEADRLADRLKRKIFTRDDLDLAHKIHLRYFCLHVETLSDRAEEVADRLAIYTIKRTL